MKGLRPLRLEVRGVFEVEEGAVHTQEKTGSWSLVGDVLTPWITQEDFLYASHGHKLVWRRRAAFLRIAGGPGVGKRSCKLPYHPKLSYGPARVEAGADNSRVAITSCA